MDHDEKYEVTFGLQDQCRPMLVDHDEEYMKYLWADKEPDQITLDKWNLLKKMQNLWAAETERHPNLWIMMEKLKYLLS